MFVFFVGVLLFFYTSKKCSKINSEQVENEGVERRLEDQGSDGTSNGQGSSRAGLEGTSVVGLGGGGSAGGGGDGGLSGASGSVNGSGGQAGGGGSRNTGGGGSNVGRGVGDGSVLDGEEGRVGLVGGVGDQDRVELARGNGGGDLDGERTGLSAVQVTEGGETGNGDLDTVSTLNLEHDGEGGVGEVRAVVGPGDGGILTSSPGGRGDGGTVFEELGRGDGGDGRGGDGEDGGGLHVCCV